MHVDKKVQFRYIFLDKLFLKANQSLSFYDINLIYSIPRTVHMANFPANVGVQHRRKPNNLIALQSPDWNFNKPVNVNKISRNHDTQ